MAFLIIRCTILCSPYRVFHEDCSLCHLMATNRTAKVSFITGPYMKTHNVGADLALDGSKWVIKPLISRFSAPMRYTSLTSGRHPKINASCNSNEIKTSANEYTQQDQQIDKWYMGVVRQWLSSFTAKGSGLQLDYQKQLKKVPKTTNPKIPDPLAKRPGLWGPHPPPKRKERERDFRLIKNASRIPRQGQRFPRPTFF